MVKCLYLILYWLGKLHQCSLVCLFNHSKRSGFFIIFGQNVNKKMTTITNIINYIKEGFVIFAPIIISIYTYLYARKSRLYFIEDFNVQLFHPLAFKLTNIEIKKENLDISSNYRLIQGSIILKGTTDVKPDEIYSELKLNTSGTWKEFKILSSTFEDNLSFEISDKNIVFNKVLFKQDDCINFEGLYESNENNIKLKHRFFNVGSRVEKIKTSNKFEYFGKLVALILVLIILSFSLLNGNRLINRFVFKVQSDLETYDFDIKYYNKKKEFNNTDFELTEFARKNLESNLKFNSLIENKKYEYNDTISIKYFYKNYYIDENGNYDLSAILLEILIWILLIYVLFSIPATYRKYYNLNKLINKTKIETTK